MPKKTDWIAVPLLFAGFLALYLTTLCRGIYLGDSGELTAAAVLLDVAHPPGYPLYCLAGRLFAAPGLGSAAAALNFFSALTAAAAVALLFFAARRLAGAIPSLIAALLLGLSSLLWSQAVFAEVYAPHLVLFLLTVGTVLGKPTRRAICLAGFLAGLAVASHPLGIGLIPLVIVGAIDRGARWGRDLGTTILYGLLFAVAGATIFLYLPIRSALDPPTDWGNPESIGGFFAHLFRTQYSGVPKPDWSVGLFIRQVVAGFRELMSGSLPTAAIPFALLGIYFTFPEDRRRSAVPFAGFLLYGPLLIGYLRFPLAPDRVEENLVFLLPLLVFLALFVAAGLEGLFRFLRGSTVVRYLIAAALAAFILVRFPGLLERNRFDEVRLPEAYAREILRVVPRDGDLVAKGDDVVFPLLYLREVEGIRPDAVIYNPGGTAFGRNGSPPDRGAGSGLYYTYPEREAIPSGLLFRDEGADPPGTGPYRIPEKPPRKALLEACSPLRAFWTNYMETRARSATDLAEASRFRLAALELDGRVIPADDERALRYAEASLLVERAKMDEASSILAGLVDEEPNDVLPRLLLAEIRLYERRNEEALELVAHPSIRSATGLSRSGAVLLYCGEKAAAKDRLQAAARMDSLITDPHVHLQQLAADDEDWEESIRQGRRAVEIDPATASARLRLARAYANMEKSGAARKHYRALLEIAPAHPAAAEARTFLER